MNLVDTYRTLNPTENICTFFSKTNGTFTKIDSYAAKSPKFVN